MSKASEIYSKSSSNKYFEMTADYSSRAI